MSAGYMAVVMPMYLAESLPPEIRGRGTGIFQLLLGIGLVSAALAGIIISWIYGADTSCNYR
jgi:MFS family permease